jgi:hypothetical protein
MVPLLREDGIVKKHLQAILCWKCKMLCRSPMASCIRTGHDFQYSDILNWENTI